MLLNRTQVEKFQNSKLCLLRAFSQTPGRRPGHLLPLLINRRAQDIPCTPTPSRVHAPASPQCHPPSPALARAKPRRRRTKKSHRRSPHAPSPFHCSPHHPAMPLRSLCHHSFARHAHALPEPLWPRERARKP
jgi:hypothetical protein